MLSPRARREADAPPIITKYDAVRRGPLPEELL